MTKYEIEVIKKFLNDAMRQLDAEVPGQTIIPGYADTDSSKVYLSEEGYVTYKVSTYGRNRGYIAHLILMGMQCAGRFAVVNHGDVNYNGIVEPIMEALDIIFQEGE